MDHPFGGTQKEAPAFGWTEMQCQSTGQSVSAWHCREQINPWPGAGWVCRHRPERQADAPCAAQSSPTSFVAAAARVCRCSPKTFPEGAATSSSAAIGGRDSLHATSRTPPASAPHTHDRKDNRPSLLEESTPGQLGPGISISYLLSKTHHKSKHCISMDVKIDICAAINCRYVCLLCPGLSRTDATQGTQHPVRKQSGSEENSAHREGKHSHNRHVAAVRRTSR